MGQTPKANGQVVYTRNVGATPGLIGSYRFTASSTSLAVEGPSVSIDGTFDAPLATNCQRTKVMK